jgi:DNA mismatch repair protein MutS2
MLKAFAHAREGMMNAGMEFDEASGRPTYRLVKGAPASSRALATARALGLSEEVLADAEARLGEDRTAMETLLQDLHRDALRARRDREAIEAEREAAEHARVEAEARLEGVAKEKKKALRAAHEEAQELLREYRAEAEKVLERIREIRKAEPRPGAKDRARVEQRRLSELSRRAGFEARRLQPLPPNATQEPLHEGQSVALRTMKGFGTVKRIDERRGRAEVDVGGLTFDVETADLIPIKREELPRRLHSRKREDADSRPPIERELHLLGMRVEAALEATRKYVDDAVMADADEVRIVHGFGTGALQKAISEFLKTHPSVDSFRPGKKGEGGAGATVVKLK